MGAGASSMNRLRKALLIRAYNVRTSDETLEEQFRRHAYRKGDRIYISISSVKTALSADAPWVDELFERAMGGQKQDFEFFEFMDFLETGKLPVPPPAKNIDSSKAQFMKSFDGRVNTDPPQTRRKPMPPTPPRKHTPPRTMRRTDSFSRYIPAFDPEYSTLYPGVVRALGLNTLAEGIHNGALVKSAGLGIALTPKDAHRTGGPTKPLWRKREIVKQERIIEYTTVDETGNTQELVEKETTQTEVLHMECRETGEFAHRETTDYEHTETFNKEVVHEQSGKEEYLHLKSTDDEFEYMESNMPKREAPEEPTAAEEEEAGPLADDDDPAAPAVDVGAEGRGQFEDDEDEARGSGVPSSRGLGGNNGAKRDFYAEDESEDDRSPGRGGMWRSMGAEGWVPPPSSDDAQHRQTYSFDDDGGDDSEDGGSPAFAKYEEPAGRRRPDLFAPDGSPVPPDKYAAEAKGAFSSERGRGRGRQAATTDVWTADNGDEDDAGDGVSPMKDPSFKRSGSSSKDLTSDDFRDPGEDNEPVAEAKQPSSVRSRGAAGSVYSPHDDDDRDEDATPPPIVRWGTEDDID